MRNPYSVIALGNVNRSLDATDGVYRVDLTPKGLTSGVYFYRLRAGAAVHERKLLYLK